MKEYFNEGAYNRWFRQHELIATNYQFRLNNIRLTLNGLTQPLPETALTLRENIEKDIDEIEKKKDEAKPRNFNPVSPEGKPLTGFEKFGENCIVLINLITEKTVHRVYIRGVYLKEKDRVLKIHQDFHFREKMENVEKEVQELLNVLAEFGKTGSETF